MKDCEHNFVKMLEGTTVRGSHLHVYKCGDCGLLDFGYELK